MIMFLLRYFGAHVNSHGNNVGHDFDKKTKCRKLFGRSGHQPGKTRQVQVSSAFLIFEYTCVYAYMYVNVNKSVNPNPEPQTLNMYTKRVKEREAKGGS